MKLLFRAAHLIEVQSLMDLLNAEEISCALNEPMPFFAEGTVHQQGMPEILVEDSDFERAMQVKQDWLAHTKGTGPS
jgi:hypothetical protein